MKYLVDVDGQLVEVVVGRTGVTVDGAPVQARLSRVDGTPIVLLEFNGAQHRLAVRPDGGRGRYVLWGNAYRFSVEALDERTRAIRAMVSATAGPAGPAPLVAPMPGLVVRVSVAVGDVVQAGQGVIVMEAMKMENELRVVAGGTVGAVHVSPGTAVERGALLVELH